MSQTTYQRIKKMIEMCSGCQSHVVGTCQIRSSVGSTINPSKYVPEGWDCPCSICLVKPICNKGIDCPDLQHFQAVAIFCKSPLKTVTQRIFIQYLDCKFKTVREYPPQVKSVVDYAFGYP